MIGVAGDEDGSVGVALVSLGMVEEVVGWRVCVCVLEFVEMTGASPQETVMKRIIKRSENKSKKQCFFIKTPWDSKKVLRDATVLIILCDFNVVNMMGTKTPETTMGVSGVGNDLFSVNRYIGKVSSGATIGEDKLDVFSANRRRRRREIICGGCGNFFCINATNSFPC